MIIDIITLFPEMYDGVFNNSIIKRAIEKKLVKINVHDFRSYSLDKHHRVDDTTYGGGAGMLIGLQALTDCLKAIDDYQGAHKIITSPIGKTFNQQKALELSKKEHIIIISGHYEGIDDRIEKYVNEEISIGDYILTGGEIPSLAIIDSVIRLLDGAITKSSIEDESFNKDLLEYPQYTKPAVYDTYKVPEVLINGNHEEIREFRLYESLKRTYLRRSDLLQKHHFSKEEEMILSCIKEGLDYKETFSKIKELKKRKK